MTKQSLEYLTSKYKSLGLYTTNLTENFEDEKTGIGAIYSHRLHRIVRLYYFNYCGGSKEIYCLKKNGKM